MKIKVLAVALLVTIYGCAAHPPELSERDKQIKKAIEQLKSKDADERVKAVCELDTLKATEYAKDIAKLLNDREEFDKLSRCPEPVCCVAIEALGKLGAKEYTEDIVKLLKDKDRLVRINAIYALIDLDAKEHSEDVVVLLKDKDVATRMITMVALARFGAKEYVGNIRELLNDKNENVRKMAEELLKKWGVDIEKARGEK